MIPCARTRIQQQREDDYQHHHGTCLMKWRCSLLTATYSSSSSSRSSSDKSDVLPPRASSRAWRPLDTPDAVRSMAFAIINTRDTRQEIRDIRDVEYARYAIRVPGYVRHIPWCATRPTRDRMIRYKKWNSKESSFYQISSSSGRFSISFLYYVRLVVVLLYQISHHSIRLVVVVVALLFHLFIISDY